MAGVPACSSASVQPTTFMLATTFIWLCTPLQYFPRFDRGHAMADMLAHWNAGGLNVTVVGIMMYSRDHKELWTALQDKLQISMFTYM